MHQKFMLCNSVIKFYKRCDRSDTVWLVIISKQLPQSISVFQMQTDQRNVEFGIKMSNLMLNNRICLEGENSERSVNEPTI